jgi:hypothetical protein
MRIISVLGDGIRAEEISIVGGDGAGVLRSAIAAAP